jgi:hypothetical protein
LNDLTVATVHLVDGGQIVSNMATQGQSAAQATATSATNGFNSLRTERNRIHNALWGVNWPSVPPLNASTVAHLTGLVSPTASPSLAQLVQDMASLESKQATVVANALAAGKQAFLNAEGQQDDARDEFDLAFSLSQSALTKLDNPGKPPAIAMTIPSTGSPRLVAREMLALGPRAPTTTIRVEASRDVLTKELRDVTRLEFVEIYPSGRSPGGGTACLTCPRDYSMAPIWRSMDRARVRDAVTIRVYNGRTLVADLGTHRPGTAGWTAMPASLTMTPPARTSDPGSGCGYRVVVTDTRGQSLGESETCLERRSGE